MDPSDYLEQSVRDVLTADEPALDDRIAHAALLLAVSGATTEADRLITHWQSRTERPVTALAATPLRARAWAMLFEHTGKPDWAEGLPPLDLDAEERAHTAWLAKPVSDLEGALPPGIVAEIANHVAPSRTDPRRQALANGDLAEWAARAGARPDVAALAATRSLAPRLVAGEDPLGLGDHVEPIAGALIAALHERYPRTYEGWPELLAEILRLRGADTAGEPASPESIEAAEARLGIRLPDDYRDFLCTTDGLPADVVFPRLLGAAELREESGVVVLSEPAVILLSGGFVVEVDPVLGTSAHRTFRDLLTRHASLLAR